MAKDLSNVEEEWKKNTQIFSNKDESQGKKFLSKYLLYYNKASWILTRRRTSNGELQRTTQNLSKLKRITSKVRALLDVYGQLSEL